MGENMVNTRLGYQNTVYDPDRDEQSNKSNPHYHRIMQSWGYKDGVEQDEGLPANRYRHTDFMYGETSVQKKAIVECGYETVTVPAHCWNDETPFAELLFHGYYAKNNPKFFIRACLLDVNILKSIPPCGTRRNWKTQTDFHYWSYDRVEEAMVERLNIEVVIW
jgi:hypothetical protein